MAVGSRGGISHRDRHEVLAEGGFGLLAALGEVFQIVIGGCTGQDSMVAGAGDECRARGQVRL